MPGDVVQAVPATGQLRLGPGLITHGGNVVANRSGVMRQGKGGQLWLEGRQKRCVGPCAGFCMEGALLGLAVWTWLAPRVHTAMVLGTTRCSGQTHALFLPAGTFQQRARWWWASFWTAMGR